MREKTLKPWHGAAFFLLIMIVFFAICVPLQSHFGLYGVAATEIILLILALLFAKVMGYSLRSLFPVHSPEGLPMLGTILMWISSYILAMVVSLIQYRLFPGEMETINEGLNDVIYSVPFWVSVIVVALLPAICEEAGSPRCNHSYHVSYPKRMAGRSDHGYLFWSLSCKPASFPAYCDPGSSYVLYYAGDRKYGIFLRVSYDK